jgi:hypothetical protein
MSQTSGPQLPTSNPQLPNSNSQLPIPNSQLPNFSSQSQITTHGSEISVAARTTRLVRVPDLHAFRVAAADLACAGTPFEVRDRMVVVPTRAAAVYLTSSIETHRLGMDEAVALPVFATRAELHLTLTQRLHHVPIPLTPAEREVLMGAACRMARDAGSEPPFRLRPGLIAAVLDFYDTLHRNLKPLDTFERLALGMLEPGAADDRGAERLVRQTQFLVAAFRAFERLREGSAGVDEHLLRRRLLWDRAARPWRHIVVTVGDRGTDEHGLFTAVIEWIVSHEELVGPVNLCAPNPLPNAEMMKLFREMCRAPFGLPATELMLEIGAFFLRTETELIFKSRRVIPGRLIQSGFQFRFPFFRDALKDLVFKT